MLLKEKFYEIYLKTNQDIADLSKNTDKIPEQIESIFEAMHNFILETKSHLTNKLDLNIVDKFIYAMAIFFDKTIINHLIHIKVDNVIQHVQHYCLEHKLFNTNYASDAIANYIKLAKEDKIHLEQHKYDLAIVYMQILTLAFADIEASLHHRRELYHILYNEHYKCKSSIFLISTQKNKQQITVKTSVRLISIGLCVAYLLITSLMWCCIEHSIKRKTQHVIQVFDSQ